MPAAPAPADQVLDALGNPIRRQIVALLGAQPRAVGEVAALLPVSRPAVSKHLRILETAQLVEGRRVGTQRVFSLRRQGFDAAQDWMGAFWDDALARFRLVAENVAEAQDD